MDKFTFNAQSEKQKDLADGKGYFYETDFRGYDAQIGRFHGYDALASTFSSITPYQFGFNNPISFNDPTGLAADSVVLEEIVVESTRLPMPSNSVERAVTMHYDELMAQMRNQTSKNLIRWNGNRTYEQNQKAINHSKEYMEGIVDMYEGMNFTLELLVPGGSMWGDARMLNEILMQGSGEEMLLYGAIAAGTYYLIKKIAKGKGGKGKKTSSTSNIKPKYDPAKIREVAEKYNLKSLQSGLRDEKVVDEILEKMRSPEGWDTQKYTIGGYHFEGKYYINEGNHRMSAAIKYYIETGDSKYVDELIKLGNWTPKSSSFNVKTYDFPTD